MSDPKNSLQRNSWCFLFNIRWTGEFSTVQWMCWGSPLQEAVIGLQALMGSVSAHYSWMLHTCTLAEPPWLHVHVIILKAPFNLELVLRDKERGREIDRLMFIFWTISVIVCLCVQLVVQGRVILMYHNNGSMIIWKENLLLLKCQNMNLK